MQVQLSLLWVVAHNGNIMSFDQDYTIYFRQESGTVYSLLRFFLLLRYLIFWRLKVAWRHLWQIIGSCWGWSWCTWWPLSWWGMHWSTFEVKFQEIFSQSSYSSLLWEIFHSQPHFRNKGFGTRHKLVCLLYTTIWCQKWPNWSQDIRVTFSASCEPIFVR